MMPICPKCDAPMFLLQFQDTEVDLCEHCRGVWLDAGELEELAGDELISKIFGRDAAAPVAKGRLCPRCDATLVEFTVNGAELVLDRCPTGHGLWFDTGELRQLLTLSPTSPGATKTIDFLDSLFHPSTNNPNKETT